MEQSGQQERRRKPAHARGGLAIGHVGMGTWLTARLVFGRGEV